MCDLDELASLSPHQSARVLVLGATSLIGRFLLPALIEAGHEVVAISREAAAGSSLGALWVQADLTDAALARRLPPADAIVSLSPIWLLPAALPALGATGAGRLIAFSSTSRVTKAASPVAEERAVAQRLADGETATAAWCEVAGVGWTILRPTLIYAEGHDQNVSRLATLIQRWGVLPLSGAGAGLRQPVHAQDLAAVILTALARSQTAGVVYDLPGGEILSYRRMAERIFAGLKRTPRIVTTPPWLWRLARRAASPLLPGTTAAMGDRMSADLTFDSGPARRDLDWTPRDFHPNFLITPVEKILETTWRL